MDTSEIIKKLSKKAGVTETESKKLFELFLQHASVILKPGESLRIPGVGLFQLRIGQIESSTGQPGEHFIYSNLMIFIDENREKGEEVIINVPSEIEIESQVIDSYFSLSIGKPIIPLKGTKADEFFVPPYGPELRSLIESKVLRLLDEAEKTQGGKETETIFLKSKENILKDSQDAIEDKIPDRSDFLKTREFENLSWDFGENLSEEPEEDSEAAGEETTIYNDEPVVDSEESLPAESDSNPYFEEEVLDENSDEDIFEEMISEESERDTGFEYEDSDFDDLESEKSGDKNEKDLSGKYSETPGIDEEIRNEPGKEEPLLKNFQRVSSLTKEFNISVDESNEEEETEKIPPKITEVRGGFQKVRRTTAEFNFDFSKMKGLDEEGGLEDENEKKGSLSGSYKGYRKKSIIPSLIIAFVVIIALAGIIFMYLKLKNENHETSISDKSKQPNIIERNDDVPVTYPYDSSKGENPEMKETDKNKEKAVKVSQQDTSDIREPFNAERIENYIYKYPEGIVVQVSSWKSKSVALNEVKKYRKSGYNAFAETATVAGMGLYYRVRVGYFNSLNEAKIFANGNQ